MEKNIQFKQIFKKNLPGKIRLTGSINNVLTSTIDEANAEQRNSGIVGYSLGLGAVGTSFGSVKDTFGELCTTPEFTGVLTAGEINKTIAKPGKDVNFFSPFNVSIGHDFQYGYKFWLCPCIVVNYLEFYRSVIHTSTIYDRSSLQPLPVLYHLDP